MSSLELPLFPVWLMDGSFHLQQPQPTTCTYALHTSIILILIGHLRYNLTTHCWVLTVWNQTPHSSLIEYFNRLPLFPNSCHTKLHNLAITAITLQTHFNQAAATQDSPFLCQPGSLCGSLLELHFTCSTQPSQWGFTPIQLLFKKIYTCSGTTHLLHTFISWWK